MLYALLLHVTVIYIAAAACPLVCLHAIMEPLELLLRTAMAFAHCFCCAMLLLHAAPDFISRVYAVSAAAGSSCCCCTVWLLLLVDIASSG